MPTEINWDALGAIGEIVGAVVVVVTLVFLAIQMRQNTSAMRESYKLERAAALDRHTDSVARWRGSIAGNGELAAIFTRAIKDEALSDVEMVRLNNSFVIFINTQRSNFERANIVSEPDLAMQACRSVAVETIGSQTLLSLWERAKHWHNLASPAFVQQVDKERQVLSTKPGEFRSGSWLDLWELQKNAQEPEE